MVDVDDPSNYRVRYQRARKRLDTADIDETDRKAITAFMDRRDASGNYNASTQGTLLNQLLRCAELAHKPLHQFEETPYDSDISTFITGVQNGTIEGVKEGGYSESYVRGFRQALRLYFGHLGKDFADEIHVGSPEPGKITEDDCFTSDETARMFSVANTRDSALIALMLATGQRLTAVASIRLSDIKIENTNRGGFYLNPEAIGLKGSEGYRPMIWATPYITRWLNKHPHWPEHKDSDEIALFVTQRHGRHYSEGDNLGYSGIKKALKRVGEAANIDSSKITAHRFRHTAIRRMIRDGLSDQRIKYMVGWHADSSHLERYGSLSDETQARDIEEHYGLSPDDSDDEGQEGLPFDNCPGCDSPVSELSGASFCPDCGTPLTHSVQQIEEQVENALWDSKDKVEDERQNRGLDLMKQIELDPDAKQEFMDELKGEILAELREEQSAD